MANSDASTIAPSDLVLEQDDFHALLPPPGANSSTLSARNCQLVDHIVADPCTTNLQFKPGCPDESRPSVPSSQFCSPHAVPYEDVDLDKPIIALRRSVKGRRNEHHTQLSTELVSFSHPRSNDASDKSQWATHIHQSHPLLDSARQQNQVSTTGVTREDFWIPHVSPIKAKQEKASEQISKRQGQDVNEKSQDKSSPCTKAAMVSSLELSVTKKSNVGKRKRKRKESIGSSAEVPNSKRKGCSTGLVLPPLSSILFSLGRSVQHDFLSQGRMKLEPVAFAPPGTDPLPPLRELIGTIFDLPISNLHAAQKAPRRSHGGASAQSNRKLQRNDYASLHFDVVAKESLRRHRASTMVNNLTAQNKKLARENLKLRAELVLAYRNQFVSTAETIVLPQRNDQRESVQVINLPKVSIATELCHLASRLSSFQIKELPRDVLRCTQSFERANPFILCTKRAFGFILAHMRLAEVDTDHRLKQSVCTVFREVHLEILATLLKSSDEDSIGLFEKVYSFLLSQIKLAYESILNEQDSIDIAWSRTISEVIVKELQSTLQNLLPSAKYIRQLHQLLGEVLQIVARGLREKADHITPWYLSSTVEVSMTIAIVYPQASSILSSDDVFTIAMYNPLFCQAGIQDFATNTRTLCGSTLDTSNYGRGSA